MPATNTASADPGDRIMSYTVEQSRAYDALSAAGERIGQGNYQAQLAAHTKARRARSTFKFHVSEAHAAVVAAMPRVLSGAITPEEAMGLLHTHDVLTERLRGNPKKKLDAVQTTA